MTADTPAGMGAVEADRGANTLRTQLQAQVLEVARMQVELDATKEALVHQTRQNIGVVRDE